MKKLELLFDQFKEAAKRFPGLTHVSIIWPEDEQNQLQECYKYNSKNLVQLWEYKTHDKQGKLVVARRHWLLRSKGENWNREAAFRCLRKLAEEAVLFLHFLNDEESRHSIDIKRAFCDDVFLPEEEDNYMEPATEWCLNLYWHIPDSSTPDFVYGAFPTRCCDSTSWIEDVFYESVLFISEIKTQVESRQQPKQIDIERKSKKTKTPKKTEKKYKPWLNPKDACFLIEDNRIKFCYRKEVKDLKLRNESNPHKLLFLFAAKNPLSQVEIKKICTEKTRPSDIAKQTNTKLNEKIASMTLPDVPKNIEFVRYDDTSKCYGLRPRIKHKDDADL